MPKPQFPHPLDFLPRAGNREIRSRPLPVLPIARRSKRKDDVHG